jgi:acetyltransferase-like isoleucine patch superfamily enzyme
MIRAELYRNEFQSNWDTFVRRSKNGTFLLERGYMDYHSDRYTDRSLMFFDQREQLVALMPIAERDGVFSSHGGLTYGGVVSGVDMTAAKMLDVFKVAQQSLLDMGARSLLYKPVPHIYHRLPSEEDLYALFRAGARLIRRDVAAALSPSLPARLTKGRRWTIGKSRKTPLSVARSYDFARFIEIQSALLQEKYGVAPVHSAAELAMLATRFQDNIKLFAAQLDGEMLAGVVIYETDTVAHAQYIASTDRGREVCALDAVVNHLIKVEYAGKATFDFGISTDNGGRSLNTGLSANKESWGARSITYDWYDLDLVHNWEAVPLDDVFIHPTADVQSAQIGRGTRIWQFVVIVKGARIGTNCNICSHCFIEGDVIIGDDVTLKSGVQLWEGTELRNGVFVGPNATFTNDLYPRSRHYPESFPRTIIGEGASIGANATLLPGITIGARAMIGAGAVVLKDVPEGAVVVGNPGRIVRTVE